MIKRKIAVITGSRADYGLLRWLLADIAADNELDLQIIATGMHLSPEYGLTYRNIEADGFEISDKVEMLLSSDTNVGMATSVGLGVAGFANCLQRANPDIVVVLGDRFEIFAAAQAAALLNIVIAHIHGGEVTEGAIDERLRHAITKLSYYHFVAAEAYRSRVIKMGEQPDHVINVGAPGLDAFKRLPLIDLATLDREINFKLDAKFFLVTYHPVTMGNTPPDAAMAELLAALDRFPEFKILITKPNADAGGRLIAKMVDDYANAQPHRVCSVTSLGQVRYLSAMKHCAAVIGNSSSGIIEAPAVPKASVNVGERQTGRIKAQSVIDCAEDASQIENAIRRALSDSHKASSAKPSLLYGDGTASRRIKDFLKQARLEAPPLKRFYDETAS